MHGSERAARTAQPRLIAAAWRMRQGARAVECHVWSHDLGWDLRLLRDGELVQSQIARTLEDLVEVCGEWRREMTAQGWKARALRRRSNAA